MKSNQGLWNVASSSPPLVTDQTMSGDSRGLSEHEAEKEEAFSNGMKAVVEGNLVAEIVGGRLVPIVTLMS